MNSQVWNFGHPKSIKTILVLSVFVHQRLTQFTIIIYQTSSFFLSSKSTYPRVEKATTATTVHVPTCSSGFVRDPSPCSRRLTTSGLCSEQVPPKKKQKRAPKFKTTTCWIMLDGMIGIMVWLCGIIWYMYTWGSFFLHPPQNFLGCAPDRGTAPAPGSILGLPALLS